MSKLAFLEKDIKEFDETGGDYSATSEGKAILSEFIERFPIKSLETITKEQYALGHAGYRDSFCYWLETKLKEFGDIHGSTAMKFGVYYGKLGDDRAEAWRWAKWTQSDFKVVRQELNWLLVAGQLGDFDEIERNQLSPMFKGKILVTYFPERFLNIFSYDHVKYFLKQLGEYEYPPLERAKQKLLAIKNADATMRAWSNLKFAAFLYWRFGEVLRKSDKELDDDTPGIVGKKLKFIVSSGEYQGVKSAPAPALAAVAQPKGANTTSGSATSGMSGTATISRHYKPDYEKLMQTKQQTGNEGEIAIVEYEKNKLVQAGRQDLADLVERVSERDDSLGYDIKSFAVSGEEKHIEVKTTKGSASGAINFYLTDNELQRMQADDKYVIYYVSDIYGAAPKVKELDLGQVKAKFEQLAQPVLYRLTFREEKK